MTENRIAVFASGAGSNFKNILEKTSDGFIPAETKLLVTDNYHAGAIEIARNNNIPVNLSNLTQGTYLIQVIVGTTKATSKIIINK